MDKKRISASDFGDNKDSAVAMAKPSKKDTSRKAKVGKQAGRKAMTLKEKFLRGVLRKAGLDELPPLSQLIALRKSEANQMRICDIAIFIGKPRSELLQELAGSFDAINDINLSAKVNLRNVKKVGAEILQAGVMFMPICVAHVKESGIHQCWSGRHRLAFLALVYGATASIPVLVDELTQSEARDAVVYANESRRVETMEKANHAVLRTTGGDMNMNREDSYKLTVTRKSAVAAFCTHHVLTVGVRGCEFGFEISENASRKGGGLTTVRNVQGFWKKAIPWTHKTSFADFDTELKLSVEFLNALAKGMQTISGFTAKQHLAAMPLVAIGKYYRTIADSRSGDPMKEVRNIAKTVVGMGDIARIKSDVLYENLVCALKKV